MRYYYYLIDHHIVVHEREIQEQKQRAMPRVNSTVWTSSWLIKLLRTYYKLDQPCSGIYEFIKYCIIYFFLEWRDNRNVWRISMAENVNIGGKITIAESIYFVYIIIKTMGRTWSTKVACFIIANLQKLSNLSLY